MIVPSDASPPCYCRHCDYDLRATTAGRCPECGKAFDPTNPSTFRCRPRRGWFHYIKRAAYGLLAVMLILALIWLWFFWGWYDEQQALKAVPVAYTRDVSLVPRLQKYLGPPGFVFMRTFLVKIDATTSSPDLKPLARLTYITNVYLYGPGLTDLRPLAKLQHLSVLHAESPGLTDLTSLAGLTNLRELWLSSTLVTDLTPLAGLQRLEMLYLSGTQVANLTPLAGLQQLKGLNLFNTQVTDLAPLAGLRQLEDFSLSNSLRMQKMPFDIAPLMGIKSLRTGHVLGDITKAQIEEFQRVNPDCRINWYVVPPENW